jgi:hypothetical protein
MAKQVEYCTTCGRHLGKAESAHLWKNEVVCSGCFARFTAPPATTPPVTPSITAPPMSSELGHEPVRIYITPYAALWFGFCFAAGAFLFYLIPCIVVWNIVHSR